MTADTHVANPDILRTLYGTIPNLHGVRVRSINLNPYGPSVKLRVDLPGFPGSPPPEWLHSGADSVQCQFEFLAVSQVSLTRWEPPASGDVVMEPWGARRRMHVLVKGAGVHLAFDCHELATVSHVSAFKIQPDGADSGPHLFASRLDARLYDSIPETSERKFHGR